MARKLPSFPMGGTASNADLQKLVRELEHQLSRKANVIDGRVYATDEQPVMVLDAEGNKLRLGQDVIPPMQPAGDYAAFGQFYEGTFSPGDWVTIAESDTASGYAEFMISQNVAGAHSFMHISVINSYGTTRVEVLNGVSYSGNLGFDAIASHYSTAHPVYGGCKIQVRVAGATPTPMRVQSLYSTQHSGWANLHSVPLVNEGEFPPGWTRELELNYPIAGNGVGGSSRWTAPTMQNSWAAYGGSYGGARWRKHINGMVTIQGLVEGGTPSTNSTVFTLPVGARPGQQLILPAVNGSAFGRMDIKTTGEVTATSGTATWFSICCNFMAEL